MADTVRTRTALLALLANNTTGDISPQDLRDFMVSTFGGRAIRTVTGDATLTTDDSFVLVDGLAADAAITLPDPATCPGKVFTVKLISAAHGAILSPAAGTLDGAASATISLRWLCRTVISDGTGWLFDVREDW